MRKYFLLDYKVCANTNEIYGQVNSGGKKKRKQVTKAPDDQVAYWQYAHGWLRAYHERTRQV